jgi:hypothetical protein
VLRLLARRHATELPSLNLDASLTQELRTIITGTVQFWLDKEIRTNSFLSQLARADSIHRNSR